jgi:hypothetical protein
MDISELIEIGLAETDPDRVEVVDLEPVDIVTEGVVGLSAIVSQLIYNATELLSDEGDRVRISGVLEPGGYSLFIIDRGVGMSDEFLEGLNLILANPRDSGDGLGASGVQLVAGLAARHGIGVRLEHGDPGVTARVSIPDRMLEDGIQKPSSTVEPAPVDEPAPDAMPFEPVPPVSKVLSMDTEAFLESVFGPLRDGDAVPAVRSESPVEESAPGMPTLVLTEPSEPLTGYRRATLRTRIPGRNYSESDPAETHTKAGEAAVEIKLALTDFTRGRQAATRPDRDQST